MANKRNRKFKGKGKKQKEEVNVLDVYTEDNDERETGNFDEMENMEYNDNQDFDIEDDEEIDEDEAFDSEDERKYGEFFASKEEEEEDDEEEEEEEDYSDDGEGYDLSEMLNDNVEESTFKKQEKSLLPIHNEEEFEELGEGMSDIESEDENENEDNDNNLVSFIDSLDSNKRKSEYDLDKNEARQIKRHKDVITEAFDESEYNLQPKVKQGKKLDIKDFVGALSDEVGFGNLKKQLVQLEKPSNIVKKEVLNAPLSKREQDRLEREVAYEQTNKEVSKWTNIIKRNREADHIVFNNDEQKSVRTNASLTTHFKPQTSLESEITKLMEDAGVTEKKESKFEELELNKVSPEEIKERRKELQRMRSLLFYQEQKMKKAAKIKSKAYHRILKKEKQRKQNELSLEQLEELDPELAAKERMKLETERARERVTLRHKNTGKWARRMLQRGNDANEETRQAIIDQLNQHENLKRKIQDAGDDSDEFDSNDEAYDDNVDSIKEKAMNQLDKMEDAIDNEEKPQKGIFAMKFMQKTFEKQRSLAKQSIIDMKKEMEENEKLLNDDSDNEDNENNKDENTVNVINTGRMQFTKGNKNKDNDESDDEETKPINISTSSSLKVSGPINVNVKPQELKPVFEVEEFKIDENDNPWLDSNENLVQGSKKHVNLNSKSNKQQKALEKLSQEKKKVNKNAVANNEIKFDEMKKLEQTEETTAKLSIAQDEHKETKKPKENIKETLEKEQLEEARSEQIDNIVAGIATENSNDIEEDNFQSITRGDLLQMAFSENDVFEDEFNEEKQKLIDEDNADDGEEALPGWGSWSGKGVKKRKKKAPKVEKKPKPNTRKDAKLKNVIINERRIKKSVKLMVSEVPHPFENREQYEKSLRAPVGKEWTTVNTHKEAIRPRVLTMPGKIIHPLKFTKQFSDKKSKRPSKSKL
ncbi:small-subunit processome [Anaeromyces robustus]|uniref:Small-subunit processome n=1 Tax=Anaeromyces robustus TaxID=1754192 RepID=A0A1Y1WS54_9FUNG|nr:small-subunit processome [Anaeromyces robustus]|eukprot:ORX76369.1 small-subunit processome [Anaeromyces robustus]